MTAALEGGEWSAARPGRTLPPGKKRYPFYMRLGGPQGLPGRAKNLVPTGIRFPDRAARSESLYRLSYAGPPYKGSRGIFPLILNLGAAWRYVVSLMHQSICIHGNSPL